jgi:hypothetical protein
VSDQLHTQAALASSPRKMDLPYNSSLNTVQHATIEEAVSSVDPTDAPVDWQDSDHVICVSVGPCPFRSYISNTDRIRSRQLRVVVVVVVVVVVPEACKQENSSKLEEYSSYE